MGKTLIKSVLALTALLAIAACSSSGCLDNGSAIPLAGFYDSATGKGVSLSTISVHGVGAPADSALIRPGNSASQLYLPMHAGHPSTTWVIEYADEAIASPEYNDTVTFAYESIPYFASEDCGAMYCYRVNRLEHTTHLVDSVVMVDSLITNVDIERIKIYFRTAQEEPAE